MKVATKTHTIFEVFVSGSSLPTVDGFMEIAADPKSVGLEARLIYPVEVRVGEIDIPIPMPEDQRNAYKAGVITAYQKLYKNVRVQWHEEQKPA